MAAFVFPGTADGHGGRGRLVRCCARELKDLQVNEVLKGVVKDNVGANSAWVDCGVVRDGKGGEKVPVIGRLKFDGGRKEKVGAKVVVAVKRAQPGNGRLELKRQVKPRRKPKPIVVGLENLTVGQELSGEVVYLWEEGALLDVGADRPAKKGVRRPIRALMRRKDFREDWASDLDGVLRQGMRVIKVGDDVTVYVIRALVKNALLKVSGTQKSEADLDKEYTRKKKQLQEKKARMRKNRPSPGDSFVGTVQKVLNFGAMLDIGWTKRGLLHWSKLPEDLRYEWRDEFPVGTKLNVVVENIRANDDLDLRLVDDVENSGTNLATARPSDASAATAAAASPTNSSTAQANVATSATSAAAPKDGEHDEDEEEEEDYNEDDDDDDPFDESYFEDKYG